LLAAVDSSYDLLTPVERRLFNRLAVFAGSWTLEAAEAVCAIDEGERSEMLEVVTALVDKSLVVAEPGAGTARYRPLETLRQYTQRELQVLRLVADGNTNREVATTLVISDGTVKRHLDNIFAKLGVSSRAAATAAALRSGIT
jgi:DNA-binding NarL/FixJ family response regulator